MISFIYNFASLMYLSLIGIFYILKKKISNIENKIYTKLLIVSYTGLIIDTLGYIFLQINSNTLNLVNIIVSKCYLIYFLLWITFFKDYIVSITKTESQLKKSQLFSFIILIVFVFIDIFLRLELVNSNGQIYSKGIAVLILYIIVAIHIVYLIYIVIKNMKNLSLKKKMPFYIFILLGIIVMIIQFLYPQILLITSTECFITCLMYFTIENPDMKLLKELHEAKEISDKANEEKTIFLYNITTDSKDIINDIEYNANDILENNKVLDMHNSARNIKSDVNTYRIMVNELLDVSMIDASKIKIYNKKYNLKLLLNSITSSFKEKCKFKNVDFRYKIDYNLPSVLYGDSISLKEGINSLLNFSLENIEYGYIELNVNGIIKNNILRLFITIEDTTNGMLSSELIKAKTDDKYISLSYKIVTLLGGTMVITSNFGVGNKFKIILDQKIKIENNDILKKEKILIINDNIEDNKLLNKLLKNKFEIDVTLNIKEALEKIKLKNKYNYIILNEKIGKLSYQNIISKLENIKNFNIPIILLTNSKLSVKDGSKFKKVLLRPIKNDFINFFDELK